MNRASEKMDSSSVSDGSSSQVRTSEPEGLRIRKNLMLKLGVHTKRGRGGSSSSSRRETSRSILGKVQHSTEALKGNERGPEPLFSNLVSFLWREKHQQPTAETDDSVVVAGCDSDDGFPSTTEDVDPNTITRRLTFNEEVSACPIPKREEYSKRIREHLWSSSRELMFNCERNSIEFAAEGWNWRNSLEDDQMYRCVATGELVHPVHVEGLIAQ